jgi:hypothetical protein
VSGVFENDTPFQATSMYPRGVQIRKASGSQTLYLAADHKSLAPKSKGRNVRASVRLLTCVS